MALGRGCQKFTGPGKDGSEEECPGGRASPAPPEPRPARRVFAKDCPEEVRGRGLPGRGSYPGSGAFSSPRLRPAGGRTRARSGRREAPQEAGLRLSAGFDPGSPELATRSRLSPNPCHLSSLGWQRSPRTGPGYRSPRFSRPEEKSQRRGEGRPTRRPPHLSGDVEKAPGATEDASQEPRVPGRSRPCHGPPAGREGSPGETPSLEAVAASRAGCRARPRPQQPAGGLRRAPVGQGCAALGRASSEPPCGRRARLL